MEKSKELKELEEKVKSKMQTIGKKVDEELPEGFGFVVLTFSFGEPVGNDLMYVSNADREDVISCMKEFIEKTENNWGNDTGKY